MKNGLIIPMKRKRKKKSLAKRITDELRYIWIMLDWLVYTIILGVAICTVFNIVTQPKSIDPFLDATILYICAIVIGIIVANSPRFNPE